MKLDSIELNARQHGVPIIKTNSHKLLEKIVSSEKPKHILEIGTAVGYSAISMLSSCDGDIITIEHNSENALLARKNFKAFGLEGRVKLVVGDCQVELAKMLHSKSFDNYFDLIFLDGPKAQYDSMLETLVYLLAPGGTLIADNILFRGYVEGQTMPPTKRYKTIIKRLNQFIENCKNHPKLMNFQLISSEDGIIIAKKVTDENK